MPPPRPSQCYLCTNWISLTLSTTYPIFNHIFVFSACSNDFDNDISAGYSEDSDYTSDLNYPVGQHANSSASQFRAAAHQMSTPQRSLETSRENSYERDDGVNHHHHQHHHLPQPPVTNQHHLSPGSISRKVG